MVYYYAYFRKCDPLLSYLITENRLEEAYHLFQLYYIINPSKKNQSLPKQLLDLDQLPEPNELSLTKLGQLCQYPTTLTSVSLKEFIEILNVCNCNYNN